jgi:hypothetical protein
MTNKGPDNPDHRGRFDDSPGRLRDAVRFAETPGVGQRLSARRPESDGATVAAPPQIEVVWEESGQCD